MDALYKCMFIIIETIVNSMKTRHVLKVIDALFMSIRRMKKEIGSHYFSFFVRSNLLTQTRLHFCRTAQLTSSEHAKQTYCI